VSFTNTLIAACKRNGFPVDTNKLTAFSQYAYAVHLKKNPGRPFAKYVDVFTTITGILSAQNIDLKVVSANSQLGFRDSRIGDRLFLKPLQLAENGDKKAMLDNGDYLLTLAQGEGASLSGSMSEHAIAVESISTDQVTFVDTLNQKRITMSREVFERDVMSRSAKNGKITWNAYRFAAGDDYVSLDSAMEKIMKVDWASLRV
jgi:hypothetical protein